VQNRSVKHSTFLKGGIDGLSTPSLIVFTTMVGFGALAKTTDLGISVAILSTLFIWGLPGQISMVEALAIGAPFSVLAISVAMANMRFLPMAISMIPLFRNDVLGWRWRYVLVHFMSVNTWVGIQHQAVHLDPEYRSYYYIGFSLVCMTGGVLGTIIGFHITDLLPFSLTAALVFLNPVYFVLVFLDAQGRALKYSVLAGCILGPLMHVILPDWGLPIVGILAGSIGFSADRILGKMYG